MAKYFRYAFAVTGDRAAVADVSVAGVVAYDTGYGFDYSRNRLTDPDAKNIERNKQNQLFYDITSALKQYQENGAPDFITTADNGGVAFSYAKNAIVRYDNGVTIERYQSLTNANTSLPTVAANWALLRVDPAYLGLAGQSFSQSVAFAGGLTGTLTGNVVGNVSGSSGSTTGNAATATALQTARTIGGVSFNGTANITVASATGGFTISGGDLALAANNITMTGSLGATGARLTKGWFVDLQVTNAIAGSVTGSSGSTTGNAATATALQTARTIGGVSFDGTVNITVASATGGFTVSGGNLVLGTNSITLTGSIGATGARVTKGWFTDLEVTNTIIGSINGNAATATTSGSTTGNAATATALQTARTIGGVSFNGTANITVASATGGFTVSGGDLALGANNITMSGSIGITGTRVTKGWFVDGEFTNAPTIGGSAATGTGGIARAISPAFTTPSLGVATAASLALTGASIPSGVALYQASATALGVAIGGAVACFITGGATAVNYLTINAQVSGSPPYIEVLGANTDIGMNLITKGQGVYQFFTNSAGAATKQVQINHVASAVNFVALQGGATGAGPAIIASGTDTNVDWQLVNKGIGAFKFFTLTGSAIAFQINSVASTVNNIQLNTGAAGTSPNISWAGGSDTNINAVLVAKGTGVLVCTGSNTNTVGVAANLNIDASGLIKKFSSSARYKRDIDDMWDEDVEKILLLRPVWYRSQSSGDNKSWSFNGLIAEEVAKLCPRWALWDYLPTDRLYDEDGNMTIREGAELVPDGIAYPGITVGLIALVQKQEQRIRKLEAQLNQ